MRELIAGRGLSVCFLAFFAILFCVSPVFAGEAVLHTKYNIHVQDKLSRSGKHVYTASYANYTDPGTGHIIISAGSKITILNKKRKLFRFRLEEDNKVVDFLYHEPRMGIEVVY